MSNVWTLFHELLRAQARPRWPRPRSQLMRVLSVLAYTKPELRRCNRLS